MIQLTDEQVNRLKTGIQAVFAIPFIDDLEDFIWEAVFAYTMGITLLDPLENIRSKQLFDIVDAKNQVGWSAKALQWRIQPECEFELVIQRADIFKKSQQLGFERLDPTSDPQELGNALLKHWQLKIEIDALAQQVSEKRICVLLKSRNRRQYALYEEVLRLYNSDELVWQWTNDTRTGLQGRRISDGFCVYRWYPNQKQLFERFQLSADALIFQVEPKRLTFEEVVLLLKPYLSRF